MKLIPKREAAKMLGISIRTLDRYKAAGCIKPVKFGKTIRYHSHDIERLMKTGIKNTQPK